MAKLFDEEGNEIEAYTQDELDAKIADLGKSKELDDAKAEVERLKKELEESGLSDGQKKRLKDEKTEAERVAAMVKKELGSQVEDLKKQLTEGHRKRAFGALGSLDEETREKVSARYESLMKTGDYPQDEEGVERATRDAYTLVSGKQPVRGAIDGVASAGARGDGNRPGATTVESDDSKAQRKLLGITDEQAQKFAPKQQ